MSDRPAGVTAPRRRFQPTRELRLEIGAVGIGIASEDPDLMLTVPRAVSRFLVAGVPGTPGTLGTSRTSSLDICVTATWRDDEPHECGRLLFDSGGLWRLHETEGRLAWTFTSPRLGSLPYKTAQFDPDFSAGKVWIHRPYFDASKPIYPLEYPLDELVVTNWLAQGRGVEIHGCAVRDADGAGYLFAGHSGAGKSTIARLWRASRRGSSVARGGRRGEPGVTILSDDRVILRKIDNQTWMYGTPWHGDEPLASPTRVLLTRGFFLRHGPRNQMKDVGRPQAVAQLLARSFPPFYSASGLDFTIAFLTEVSRLVPFSDLDFLPDRSVIEFLRASRA